MFPNIGQKASNLFNNNTNNNQPFSMFNNQSKSSHIKIITTIILTMP